MNTKETIAQLLLDIRAVGLRTDPPYTWSSGAKRPMYCDNRLIISYPEKRQIIIDALGKALQVPVYREGKIIVFDYNKRDK